MIEYFSKIFASNAFQADFWGSIFSALVIALFLYLLRGRIGSFFKNTVKEFNFNIKEVIEDKDLLK